MARFQNDLTEMFLGDSLTKMAEMAWLCWTQWPPELKIEKPLNDISSYS